MNPSQIETLVAKFREIRPDYEAFTGKLRDLFDRLTSEMGLKVHLIEGRTKTVDSFRQKITCLDKNYTDPLTGVTDIAGIRIIVYDENDIEPLCRLITAEFDIDLARSGDKLDELQPAEFGYRSVHLVLGLASSRAGLLEWAKFAQLKCEIQVRSVFQHAWAAISHALEYKSEVEAPAEQRRRLHRLSALVELADQELSSLYAGLKRHVSQVDRDFADRIPASDIDRTSLIKFLEKSPTIPKLIHIARSYGMYATWGEAGPAEDPIISELVWVCRQAGITNTEELEKLLIDVVAKHDTYLSALPRGHQMVGGFLILQVIVVARAARFIDIGPTYYQMLNQLVNGFLERFKCDRTRQPIGETNKEEQQ